jgi:ribosome-associated protein
MTTSSAQQQTRILVQAAAAACEAKKGLDTRILELDPVMDSGLSDFFLITSAASDRQAIAIADEIELRLKRDFGLYAHSVEGRRRGDWILLDYVDFVVHVFLAERRAFYDIERLRKSARPLTPAEFDAELKAELAKKTLAVRKKASAKPTAAKAAKTKAAKATPSVEKAKVALPKAKKAAKKVAMPARKAAVPAKKTAAKSASKKVAAPARKAAAKPASKKAAAKKSTASKA